MARKKKHPEHVNHERWLVSYADFITLLFAFFTTLYAISTVDAKKAGKLVFSMRAAFSLDFFTSEQPVLGGAQPEKPAPPMDEMVEQDPLEDQKLRMKEEKKKAIFNGDGSGPGKGSGTKRALELVARLKEELKDRFGSRFVNISHEARGAVISIQEAGLFESGSTELKASSVPVLESIGRLLRDLEPSVRVEGHSDDQGSDGANWELSAQRALSLVRLWTRRIGFPPARLAAAGYGSHRPLQIGGDDKARARNRRVDIVVLSSDAFADEPPR